MSNSKIQSQDIDKIFISHSTYDREYVKEFVKLLNVIGFKEIFCSSIQGYDIPNGESIYDFLKEELNELKNEIINIFKLEKIYDNLWESCRDEVIKKVKEIAENEKKFLKPARIEFESVRCKNATLEIALRYINQHDYTIEFTYLKIILIDEEGEGFEFCMDPSDEQVYYDENKIFTIEKELSDSKYNAQKHSESIIDFKYDRAF